MRRHLIVALALSASAAGAQRAEPAERAPEINLPALAGGRVELSKLRGHPVVVSFWSTWCPPCRDEFPELIRAYQAYTQAGLHVLGVNGRDQEYSTGHVQKFVTEFSVPFPVALDQRGRARDSFHVLGLPTTVFIDSSGVIQRVHRGPIGREDLDRGIALILPRR